MKILRNILDLKKAIKKIDNLGFVPTMGGLHEGHISIINKSKKESSKTIVSIFVNPKQFNNLSDYKSYPRNVKNDLIKLKKNKVDYVFLPNVDEIHKINRKKKITIFNKYKVLCAKYRKGHFEGVLDVVDRFLEIIKPKYLFLGEKDFQQYFFIKKYLKKQHSVSVKCCKTVRDKNLVALSTRNKLLSNNQYKIARLVANKLILLKKDNPNEYKINLLKKFLTKNFKIKIEYLDYRSKENLLKNGIKKNKKIFIAYYLGKVRLIDNF